MKERERACGLLPIAVGLVLMLAGAWALLAAGNTMQYILPAPAVSAEGGELTAMYEEGWTHMSSVADSFRAFSFAARAQGMSLSAGGGESMESTVYAVGAGYFDVMHETLMSGRFISETDVRRAHDVIVIDEQSALALFPGVEPIGQTLSLGGAAFEVVGVMRGGRRVGEMDEHVAYVPITAADENALPVGTMQAVALGTDAIGSAILMEDTLSAWKPGGSFYSLEKLKLGAVMPLRWAVLIVGVSVLLALLRRMNAFAMGCLGRIVEKLRLRYAREMALEIVGRALLCAAGYAALIGAASALAVFSIEPLYVFTEWVPEVVVELSSLTSRFWSLNDVNAAAVRYVSREVCVLELGQGLIRWGFAVALIGAAMRGSRWLRSKVSMPPIQWEREV